MTLVADPERRARLIEICTGLPETSANVSGREDEHLAFKVRKKTFAYYLNDHHSDGRVGLECRAAAGVQGALVESDPKRFYVPPYVGVSGWVGLRVDLAEIDWDEVELLVIESYRLLAAKTLVRLLDQSSS